MCKCCSQWSGLFDGKGPVWTSRHSVICELLRCYRAVGISSGSQHGQRGKHCLLFVKNATIYQSVGHVKLAEQLMCRCVLLWQYDRIHLIVLYMTNTEPKMLIRVFSRI